MRTIQTALLIGILSAALFSQQSPERLQAPERLFLHPTQDRPEIIPPGALADRDPVRVDPQHFRIDFQNERVRVVHVTMKGSESSPMHEEPDILAVCTKECHLRFSRPDGKFQDVHMQAGDTHWLWQDTRSERNLSTQPLEMLLIEIKREKPASE